MSFDRVRQLLLGLFVLAVVPSGYLRAAELLPLRATYSSIGGAFAPLWLAQARGFSRSTAWPVDLKYIL